MLFCPTELWKEEDCSDTGKNSQMNSVRKHIKVNTSNKQENFLLDK